MTQYREVLRKLPRCQGRGINSQYRLVAQAHIGPPNKLRYIPIRCPIPEHKYKTNTYLKPLISNVSIYGADYPP